MNRLLAIFIGLIAGASLLFQAWQLHLFMSAGQRFTAQDGQRLCERVAELERHSIGFQRSGVIQPPCAYDK